MTLSPQEALAAALLLLARADGRVTSEEAVAAWRFAREQGLAPEDLVRLSAVSEAQVVAALRRIPERRLAGFLAAAYEICVMDQQLHPEELRLFARFSAAAGVDPALYTGAGEEFSPEE
jgi:tellurite resistance protein